MNLFRRSDPSYIQRRGREREGTRSRRKNSTRPKSRRRRRGPGASQGSFIRHPVFSKVVGVATREVARATTHARNLRGGAHYDDMLKGFSQLTKALRKHVTFDQGFYNLTAQGGASRGTSEETSLACATRRASIPCGVLLPYYLQNQRHYSRRSRRSGADSSRSVASRSRGGGAN